MRSTSLLVSLAALVARTHALYTVEAFAAVAKDLVEDSVKLASGEYTMRSYSNDKYVSFQRKGNKPQVYLTSSKDSVTISFVESSGDSGTLSGSKGAVIGKDLGGGQCLSSQWSFTSASYDKFATPYACALGALKSRSAATIVDAKQLYTVVPCGPSGGSSSADLAVKITPKKATKKTTKKTTAKPKAKCPKPGWWLARHPSYIKVDDHPECNAVLKAYRAKSGRFVKRFRESVAHEVNKRDLEKRSSNIYCLVTVDHVTNQVARAISNQISYAFNDVSSLSLAALDKSDSSQWWVLEKA